MDRGQSKITPTVQASILAAKRGNPRRSVRQIKRLLEADGQVAHNSLSRSSIHRLLQHHGLSRLTGSSSLPEEKRSFGAEFAGLWRLMHRLSWLDWRQQRHSIPAKENFTYRAAIFS